MTFLIVFIISFVIYFLIDYLILKRSKKLKINEFEYLKYRYKYSKSFKETKLISLICSILNSIIMGIVCAVIIYCDYPYYISIPIGFVLLFLLIYSVYGIYGNILKRIDINGKK